MGARPRQTAQPSGLRLDFCGTGENAVNGVGLELLQWSAANWLRKRRLYHASPAAATRRTSLRRFVQSGVSDYIGKPFTNDFQLSAKVKGRCTAVAQSSSDGRQATASTGTAHDSVSCHLMAANSAPVGRASAQTPAVNPFDARPAGQQAARKPVLKGDTRPGRSYGLAGGTIRVAWSRHEPAMSAGGVRLW